MEFWKRNLFILWGAQFLAMLGMHLVIPFLPFFVRELGSPESEVAFWSGAAFAGTFFSAFLATPFWGTLGDRYGRKVMVVRAILGLALAQVLIGFSQDVYQLVFFRVLQGAISGFIASSLALVSTNTPKGRMSYALGILQSATAAGMVLGPFVGGVLADSIGYRPVFFITAGLCLISGIAIIALVREETPPGGSARRFGVIDNFRLVARHRELRIAGISLVVIQMAVLMIEPVFALFIESFDREHEYLSTITGLIFSIAGIFMIISGPWWGKRSDRVGQKNSLTIALAGAGGAYACHTLVSGLLQLAVLRAFLGLMRGAVLPGLYSLVSIHAPQERQGGVMATASSLTLLGNTMGPLLGGLLAGFFGITASFVAAGIILVGVSLFLHFSLPEMRGSTARPTTNDAR
ncbi:MAG: MFS transporter [Ignavibacteria bacterium]|nr:MFS transporter [Ignavibacteria bacterium]